MSRVPANWSELRAAAGAHLDEDEQELQAEARRAARVLDREIETVTARFQASPEYLSRLLVVGGADRARGACHLAPEALPRLLSFGDEPPAAAPLSALCALSYLTILRSLEVAVPDAATGVEARWLPIIAARPDLLTPFDRRTAGLAAVATGLVNLLPALDEGGPLATRSTGLTVAGANVAGFTRHLAEALARGEGADQVEDAWHAFVSMFPLTLAADGVQWVDLVWAATAIMVRFERRPIAEVGRWLPRFVGELD